MKVLHFSDLHIGVESYGRLDVSTGLSTRMSDFLAAFDEMVDFAITSQIDLVLFAGDAYKSREPNQTQQREFAKRIARLANANIQVFLLVGNHDLPYAFARATSIEIFDTLSIKNVTVADKASTYLIETRSGPVQISALPWPRRSNLLARESTKNLTLEEMNEEIQRVITAKLRLQAKELDKSIPSILTAHVSVSEATLGSERTMMLGNDHVILLSNIALTEFDYVALGHIHRTQILNKMPPVVYSGSLQRVDFSEENDIKGFYVVELDAKIEQGQRVTSYQFHSVNARSFITIDIKIKPDDQDPTSKILEEIRKHPIAGAIVRLRISIPAELEDMLREVEVRKALADAHFIASISKDVDRNSSVRLGNLSIEELTCLDALNAYIESVSQSRGWSQLQIKDILKEGSDLIRDTSP